MKYKIYKLIHKGVVVYVGRTKLTLKVRKQCGYKGCCVESIYRDCDIELIEETSDVSRERYWIEHYKDTVLNIIRGNTGMTHKEVMKEWEQDNREHRKEYKKQKMKELYESNREKKKEYQKEYRLKNKKTLC